MYTLYVNSMSPYSFKASAILGYAGLPCEIEHQNVVTRYTVLKRLTGKTMVPVLRRGEWAINDSSRIARFAMERSSKPLLPSQEPLEPVCWLLEEFADEWVTRWFVYSRWYHREDVEATKASIGEEMVGGLPGIERPVGALSASAIKDALKAGGVRESNREALEQSQVRTLRALEAIVEARDGNLLADHPTVADFALYGQLEQYRRDPTGGRHMASHPAIADWLDRLDRMRLPHPVVADRRGGSVDLSVLNPLFAEMFGTYWRVLVENARARERGDDETETTLVDGTPFEWSVSGYLADRLEFVLDQLEILCRHADVLLGSDRLRLGETIEEQVGMLTDDVFGGELLESRPDLVAWLEG
jgi:glutathione S-transferase